MEFVEPQLSQGFHPQSREPLFNARLGRDNPLTYASWDRSRGLVRHIRERCRSLFAHRGLDAQVSPENREEWSDHNIPKTGPGAGDSRLTPEGRAALLALVENDDFGEYLDDVCGDEPVSLQ